MPKTNSRFVFDTRFLSSIYCFLTLILQKYFKIFPFSDNLNIVRLSWGKVDYKVLVNIASYIRSSVCWYDAVIVNQNNRVEYLIKFLISIIF